MSRLSLLQARSKHTNTNRVPNLQPMRSIAPPELGGSKHSFPTVAVDAKTHETRPRIRSILAEPNLESMESSSSRLPLTPQHESTARRRNHPHNRNLLSVSPHPYKRSHTRISSWTRRFAPFCPLQTSPAFHFLARIGDGQLTLPTTTPEDKM